MAPVWKIIALNQALTRHPRSLVSDVHQDLVEPCKSELLYMGQQCIRVPYVRRQFLHYRYYIIVDLFQNFLIDALRVSCFNKTRNMWWTEYTLKRFQSPNSSELQICYVTWQKDFADKAKITDLNPFAETFRCIRMNISIYWLRPSSLAHELKMCSIMPSQCPNKGKGVHKRKQTTY